MRKRPAETLLPLPPKTDAIPVRTVGQVNALIQRVLGAHLPEVFLVAGEISNFRVYDRGHAFFTLKEPGAELACVMWKDALARLKFKPKDGLAVIARGAVKMYEPQGKVQLYVEGITVQGTGELELAFRQLCEKLKAEGLFEAGRKRAIVRLPQRVVIVTSRTGSVLHDVLTTAYRRYPGLHTMLYPVPVQGATAAPAIVRAIEEINLYNESGGGRAVRESGAGAWGGGIDLILLVRGGGSLEDLWAFNEESVARAIVASRIPVATGIGHEPDTTIADLVGDLRGPTPTGVTELTIPDAAGLGREIAGQGEMLTREMQRLLEGAAGEVTRLGLELGQAMRAVVRGRGAGLEALAGKVAKIEPRHAIAQGWRRVEEGQRKVAEAGRGRVRRARERVEKLAWRLERGSPVGRVARGGDLMGSLQGQLRMALAGGLGRKRGKLEGVVGKLEAVSPLAVLQRGYSITRDGDGAVVKSAGQVEVGEVITTRVADGEFRSTVGEMRQGELF